MPNILDANGLQTKTQAELIIYFTEAYQAIYGPDINLSQDTPDGQMMMIFIQATLDTQDLLEQVYNSFSPQTAIGVSLDQRVAINGIQRQAGTYTITNVTIVIDRALNLYGLDQNVEDVYTVKDSVGNQWQLQTTQTEAVEGSYVYSFQAENPGEVFTTPNTITIPVTIVLGVDSVNNPTAYNFLGIDEESDIDLRIRQQRSVSLASQGYLSSLLASLLNISGVSYAKVYENVTGATDSDGIPGHSIWVIVAGTATDEEIANAIYSKRNAGAGMKGTETYDVTQIDGSIFTVKWDDVETVDLFIEFNATSIDGINAPQIAVIIDYLVANLLPDVYETMNINDLATLVQVADPNTLVTGAGFSVAALGPFTDTLQPTTKKQQFIIDGGDIDITVL